MSIIVGFSTSTSVISRVIRWFTRSKASHAWVAFDCEELDIRLIMHASVGGYKLNQWTKWRKDNQVVAMFACKEDLSDGLRKMAEQLDKPYGYLVALLLAPKRWLGKLYRNPYRDNYKRLECSEAVTLLLQAHGFAKDMDPESTTPEDLLEFCTANPAFILVEE